MLRDALLWMFGATVGVLVAAFLVFVAPVLVVFVVLFAKQKGWSVKLKNLIGGVFVAVVVAMVIAKVPSVFIECSYYPFCWPF